MTFLINPLASLQLTTPQHPHTTFVQSSLCRAEIRLREENSAAGIPFMHLSFSIAVTTQDTPFSNAICSLPCITLHDMICAHCD